MEIKCKIYHTELHSTLKLKKTHDNCYHIALIVKFSTCNAIKRNGMQAAVYFLSNFRKSN